MFRFYKLYSLYMNNMTSGLTWPREWCLCEKLPRAVLHIPVNRHMLCQVCGLARRPEAGLDSSSDEDADQGTQRQTHILEQRNVEEPKKGQVTRVKVAIRGKKPKAKKICRTNCLKCGGLARAEAGQECTEAPKDVKNTLYPGRHGLYSKPKGMPRRQQVPKAPPPSTPSTSPTLSPSPSASSAPSPTAPPRPPRLATESPRSEMPSLVAMAHTVFNPKNHILQSYRNLFVSNFIPLQSPITDTFGGAISKRSRNSTRPPRCHRSRPLPPLSKVLTNILSSQDSTDGRELGGGLSSSNSKDSQTTDYELASQFCPFDEYEGPSEDALVGSSARYLLHRPKSLHIEPRQDLPNNRIESLNYKFSSTSSAKDIPNPMADNLPGILFMTQSVRKNLMTTLNKLGSECHISNKTSPPNNLASKPAAMQQTTPQNKPEESEKLERSSILSSIMDQVFCSQASESSHGIFEDDKVPELEDINETFNDMFIEDPETVSLKSDVSNEQTVFSSNKTNHYDDYSKPVSNTPSTSSWERFCDTKDDCAKAKPTLYKCARCGQHKKREDMVAKIKTNHNSPIKTDTNEIRLNKKVGIAIKQRLNSVRSGAQEYIKVEHEMENSPKIADQRVIPEIFRENLRIPKPRRTAEEIPKESILREPCINTNIQSKGQRIGHKDSLAVQTAFKIHRTFKYLNLQAKEDKPLGVNNPAIINDKPRNTLPKIHHECLGKRHRNALKDTNILRSQVPVNMKPSTNWGVIQIFGTVIHQCHKIPKLQVATFVRELVDIGQTIHGYIQEYTPSSLFEFRMPDISPNELLTYRNLGENSYNNSGSVTPIPHKASPKKLLLPEQSKIHKKTSPQAHSVKYESREIRYKTLELSFNAGQTDSFNHPNDKLLHYDKQIAHNNTIHTNDASNLYEADSISGMKTEEDRKSLPIKSIDANLSCLSDNNVSQSKFCKPQAKNFKWHTSDVGMNILEKEENPLKESNPKAVNATFSRSKENKENSKELYYQKKPIAIQKYNSSKLSNEIRKQIDKSLQLKIKKIMSKPIKLLRSTDSDSVERFVEPFTNKLSVSEEYNLSSSRSPNVILSPPKQSEAVLNTRKESTSSSSSMEISSSQKPLRLLENPYSSNHSELEDLTMESKIETDCDAASEPKMTCKTTEYEGLPPLNWQVISMGSAHPNNTVNQPSESILEEEFLCPIYMCGCLIKSKTFASHFKRDHRGTKTKSAWSQEDCHQVVEGLPKQFTFDGDLLTQGNTFVALLFYSSLTRESPPRSLPMRNHPLALLAAPQKSKDDRLTGVFFWLIGCNFCAKLLAKLTVYDPLDRIGRSEIIRPRPLPQKQDPQGLPTNSKDQLLITVPHRKRTFQISVVIDEKQT
ncbi:uncharacterized protein LOC120452492 [Drosophila santomea]|uniref:uncharacterized protein LOC120452492 n=1 Tax=Drosophila santomea TaxID=129105 RepID=UPI001CCAC78D|nr:uncharacterized protein LOC120452492 [Drosophila santomea]